MVAAFETEPRFQVQNRQLLFEETGIPRPDSRTFDIDPDGQRFLVVKLAGAESATPPQLVLVQNWFAELQRLVPSP